MIDESLVDTLSLKKAAVLSEKIELHISSRLFHSLFGSSQGAWFGFMSGIEISIDIDRSRVE